MNDTRAGIVALAGAPNAGKSTLLNALVGERLSIVSPRPQTTWRRVAGIYSGESRQIVFVDTPGLFAARDLFHRGMVEAARKAVREADVTLVVVDGATGRKRTPWNLLRSLLEETPARRLVAVNKVDVLPGAAVGGRVSEAASRLGSSALPVSALRGFGVARLRKALEAELPRSPFLYPPDQIATEPVRFFLAELVRETVFELYDQEIPYSVSCRLEEFRENEDPIYIQAILFVERSSQKGILIGDGGRAIRALGSRARKKIERFVDRRVYLDLWVKVLDGWRRKRGHLRRLGFAAPPDHETRRAR